MAKISVINLKGGSSKSSIIMNLGGVFKDIGKNPLLIDLDPQQSATRWASQGAGQFLFPVIPLEVVNVKQFKIDLNRMETENGSDIVLFDTPPAIQNESMVAALLSDIVLIPITPSPLDLWAAEQAISTVKEVQTERGGNPNIILVPARLMPNTVLGKEIYIALRGYNELIAPAISMRIAMAEAPIVGQTINTYAPNSASHKEFMNR